MTYYGHIQRLTRSVGGREYTFRSKLEYRYAVWLQLQKEQGLIKDWFYEDPETLLELETRYLKNKKLYLPDFVVQMLDESYEYHETKGYFPPVDYTKLKLAAEQYDNPITLIFASLNSGSKNSKIRAQRGRAERLEPYLKRIIWNANRDIFKKIQYLFDC